MAFKADMVEVVVLKYLPMLVTLKSCVSFARLPNVALLMLVTLTMLECDWELELEETPAFVGLLNLQVFVNEADSNRVRDTLAFDDGDEVSNIVWLVELGKRAVLVFLKVELVELRNCEELRPTPLRLSALSMIAEV